MSSRNLHLKTLIKALSSQLTSHASWQKSATRTKVTRAPWRNEQNFVKAVCTLLVLPNMSLDLVRKSSKSSRKREFFFNNGVNHDKATPDNKVPMRPT